MVKRYAPEGKALDALIRIYGPPRKFRILSCEELEDQGSNASARSTTNATTVSDLNCEADPMVGSMPTSEHEPRIPSECTQANASDHQGVRNAYNSRYIDQQDSFECESGRAENKRRRLEEKRQAKRRWVGSVIEALSDVFTAIWANYVEPTCEFQTLTRLQLGTGKPGTDAKLLSRMFTSEKLMASRESFAIQYRVMHAFDPEASMIPDWDTNPSVNAYMSFLKSDAMIHDCCLGLYARLGTPQLKQVDEFVDILKQVWFQPVLFGGSKLHCGYHHVCIGDFSSKARALSGMHNWFKFLLEEERRNTRILNCFSYERDLHLISLSFSMKHPSYNTWYTKLRSSFLVGVPTDFELLLFTVITMVNPNQDTTVQIKDYEPLVVVPRTLRKSGSIVTAFFRENPGQRSDN